MPRPEAPSPEGTRRGEYRVPSGEALSGIMSRIRGASGNELFLDITDHEELRTDGALRRTLAAAAAETGKQITFSVSGSPLAPSPSPARGASVPVTVVRPAPTLTAQRVSSNAAQSHGSFERHATASEQRQKWVGIGFSVSRLSSTGKRVALIFTFLAGLLATAAVIFLVPRAEVEIAPNVEPINADLAVRASADAAQVNPADGVIPARIISLEKTVEGTFPVEHIVERGERARGAIDIVNRTGSEQRLRRGSRLKHPSGVVLIMDDAVVVPPRGSARVPVTAQEGGTKGNLRDGQLAFVALPSSAQAVLFGRVVEPLSGGTDRPVPTLAEEDVRRAAEGLAKDAQAAVREDVQRQMPRGTLGRGELMHVRIVDAVARESLGSELREFHLTGKLRGEAFAVPEAELLDLLQAMALKRTEGRKTLGKPLGLDTVRVTAVRWEDGTADFAARIENVAHEALDIGSVKERLAGRTQDGAVEYLRALPGVKDAQVTLRPFWIRRVPSIPRNVHVVLRLP